VWSLRELHVDHNHLSGWIPPEVDKFRVLARLDLSSNDLSGPIPSGIGRPAGYLRELHLENNHLSGPIPAEVGNLTQLRSADLSNNQLDGPIPASVGNLVKLERIGLAGNMLSGEIPSNLGSLTSLVDMGSDFRWNALETSDPTLRIFLDTKQTGGDWVSTQTLAPSGFSAGAPGVATVPLSWTPILYRGDGGGYRLWYGTTPGGPYELVGITSGKAASSAVVDLLTPATTYHFVAESVTDPHAHNQSRVASGVGAEVSATTTSAGQTWYGLTVAKDGPGTGTVSATGIRCGGVCAAGYAPGTSVTLVATPDSPWGFLGWSGDCSGTSATCVLTVDAPKAVTATFSGPLPQSFYTVPPCRLYDSRGASGGADPLAAATDTIVAAAGVCGLPSTARSVSLNVTVVSPTAGGHLELHAAGTARPGTSTINYSADRTRANNAIVGLGSDGAVAVYVAQPTGTVHVVLDVNGFFE
jgi:hypothetical protein